MCGVVPQSWQGAAARPRAPPSHWRIPASSLHAPSETSAVSSHLGKGLRAPPQDPAQATVIADGAQPGTCAALDPAPCFRSWIRPRPSSLWTLIYPARIGYAKARYQGKGLT